MKLRFWNTRDERVKALREQLRETAQKLGKANALNHQHETTIATLNNAIQDWQHNLATEQKWTETLVVERNEARKLVAEMASENVILTDRIRHLEASLSGVREELRQERVERARAEEAAAEHAVTIDGLGLAMRDLEQAAAQRRVILPGQRADLHDVDQEKRYEDGTGDQ